MVGEPLGLAVPNPSRMRYLARSAAEGTSRARWGVAPADEWCEDPFEESWIKGIPAPVALPLLLS